MCARVSGLVVVGVPVPGCEVASLALGWLAFGLHEDVLHFVQDLTLVQCVPWVCHLSLAVPNQK